MSRNDFPKQKKEKDPARIIESALKRNIYLQQIAGTTPAFKEIVQSMTPKIIKPFYSVTEVGKPGYEMFVCEEGSLEVYTADNIFIKTIRPGEVFGEEAFISLTTRKLRVVATADCKLWVLNQSDYSKVLRKYFKMDDGDLVKYLKEIPIFRELNRESLLNISAIVRVARILPYFLYGLEKNNYPPEIYPENVPIIKQGEEGSEFFIITGGTVAVSVECPDGKNILLVKLKKNDFFGEGALMENEKRRATVTAEAPGVECLVLDREHFSKFFGDLESIRQAVKKRREMTTKIVENDIEFDFVQLHDLEIKDTINNCEFGRVDLAQYKSDHKLVFALKTLKKCQVAHCVQDILTQKYILMSSRSPFVVRLYKTFQDKKFLYFLQEACLGGDLKFWLVKKKNLDNRTTRFICACIIEALAYLHSRNIVYNNLKTENLVFDSKGYIKLVGFGNARKIDMNIGNSHDGLHDSNFIKNFDVFYDCFSFGCLIYEILVGRAPFDDIENENITNKNIKQVKFPLGVTPDAQSIMKQLWRQSLTKGSEWQIKRDDLKYHQWFHGFDWSSLQNETLPAPWVPDILHHADLSNFNKSRKDKEIPRDVDEHWDF